MNCDAGCREENACVATSACGSTQSHGSVPHCSGSAACGSNTAPSDEIKSGWGGQRPGAGRKPTPQRVIQSRPSGPRWYVVELALRRPALSTIRDLLEGETRPGYVHRQPLQAELPMEAVERHRNGQRVTIQVPMFHGYAFVQFDRETDDWGAIASCDGVTRVMTTRTLIPIPVPVGFVEALVETAGDRLKLPETRLTPHAAGQFVKVEAGPFTGFQGTCLSCDGLSTRVRVHLFGRPTDIQMRRDNLSVVG